MYSGYHKRIHEIQQRMRGEECQSTKTERRGVDEGKKSKKIRKAMVVCGLLK